MKKTRALAILLAALTLGSFTACNGGGNESSSSSIQTENPPESTAPVYDLSSCVHEYNVTDSDVDFIKDGVTSYSIVYPAEEAMDDYVMTAITELQNLVFEATGKILPAYTDVEQSETTKILSLGKTNQAESKTALMERVGKSNLGRDGYIIDTDGDSVYMVGNTTHASLYAAYEFLHWQFDFEAYSASVYKIQRNVRDMKLKDFDILDIPDFASRTPQNGEAVNKRLRSQSYEAPFNSALGNVFCHNYFELIGGDYLDKHPKWLATTPTQLCLNAKGDKEERQALIDAVVHEMIIRFEMQPDIDWMVFSHEDGGLWCTCTACTEEAPLYDKKANTAAYATVIRFINEVAAKIRAWQQENCPERDLRLFIYDYGFVTNAPVKVEKNSKGVLEPVLDENGNYQPYSEDLMLDEMVGVYICGFNQAYYLGPNSSYEQRSADKVARNFAIMKNPLFFIWAYSAAFADYLLPCHTTETRQAYYQYFKSIGANGVFDQAQYANSATTDFGALKSYVSAKLMWNVQLDVYELIDDFMANYYGLAGEIMAEMYADYRGYMLWQINEKNNIGKPTLFFNKATYPYDRIRKFQDYVNRALAAIEPLKAQDSEAYQNLYKRILRERITWDYLMASLHTDKFSLAELERLQRKVISDAQTSGISQASEHNTVDNLFGLN